MTRLPGKAPARTSARTSPRTSSAVTATAMMRSVWASASHMRLSWSAPA